MEFVRENSNWLNGIKRKNGQKHPNPKSPNVSKKPKMPKNGQKRGQKWLKTIILANYLPKWPKNLRRAKFWPNYFNFGQRKMTKIPQNGKLLTKFYCGNFLACFLANFWQFCAYYLDLFRTFLTTSNFRSSTWFFSFSVWENRSQTST